MRTGRRKECRSQGIYFHENSYYYYYFCYQKSRQTVFYSWLTIRVIFVHIWQYRKPVRRFSCCFSYNSVACITCSRLFFFSRFLLALSFLGLIWQLQAEAGWWVSERGGGRWVEIWTQLCVLLLILCLRMPPVLEFSLTLVLVHDDNYCTYTESEHWLSASQHSYKCLNVYKGFCIAE